MSTNFPNGLESYGVPLLGGNTLPKMGGQGKVFFVDPALGSDSNNGTSPESALDTVAAAFALCTDKKGDTVYLLNDGTTSGTSRDTAIVWNKSNTHLVGLCAPAINARARIAPPTTDATDVDAYTPYITISGNGCVFANISIFQGNSENTVPSVGLYVSGARNYFQNVSVITGAAANQGDEDDNYQVQITGEENVFEKCYIGQDTEPRGGGVGGNVYFGAGASDQAARNIFRGCVFPMFADNTDPVFVRVETVSDIMRWNLFEGCTFINTGTSTIAAGVSVVAAPGGVLLFKDCGFHGCTNVTAADSTTVYCQGPAGNPSVDVGLFGGVDIA